MNTLLFYGTADHGDSIEVKCFKDRSAREAWFVKVFSDSDSMPARVTLRRRPRGYSVNDMLEIAYRDKVIDETEFLRRSKGME